MVNRMVLVPTLAECTGLRGVQLQRGKSYDRNTQENIEEKYLLSGKRAEFYQTILLFFT